MKTSIIILLLALLLVAPSASFAAFDDVTLTTDVIINVAGINLNVSGSSAVIESITVNENDFSFVLQSGSSLQVSSSDRRVLSTNAASRYIVANACNSSESVLKHSSASESVTITITPQSSICVNSATSAASGGGGLILGTLDKPVGPFSVVINNGAGVAKTKEVALNLKAGANVAKMAISSHKADLSDAALVDYQSVATWDLCSKLGGLVKLPENQCAEGLYTIYVRFYTKDGQPSETFSAAIEYRKSGIAARQPSTGAGPALFTRTLILGSAGEDVKRLQQLLNSLGFIVAADGPGSQGNETVRFGSLTEKAVQKFQIQHSIASAGVVGFGVVGPKTRAKLNELAGSATSNVPAQTVLQEKAKTAAEFNILLSKGMVHPDVRRLQQVLNRNEDTRIASAGVGSTGNETDYFGELTEKAVQKFQIKHGIVSSGAPQTTGYGLVGSKTRAKLNEFLSQ